MDSRYAYDDSGRVMLSFGVSEILVHAIPSHQASGGSFKMNNLNAVGNDAWSNGAYLNARHPSILRSLELELDTNPPLFSYP